MNSRTQNGSKALREATLKAIENDADNEKRYTKDLVEEQWNTLLSFTGYDTIAFFEGEYVGELHKISWLRNYVNFGENPKIVGEFALYELGDNPLNKIPNFNIMRDVTGIDRPKGNILLFYRNEFGHEAVRIISGATIVEEYGEVSSDCEDTITETTYRYVADEVTPLIKIDSCEQVEELLCDYPEMIRIFRECNCCNCDEDCDCDHYDGYIEED